MCLCTGYQPFSRLVVLDLFRLGDPVPCMALCNVIITTSSNHLHHDHLSSAAFWAQSHLQRRGFPEPDRDFFAVAASLGMALLPVEKTMEDVSALLVECYPSRDECKLADGAADTVETFLVHHAHFVVKLVRAFSAALDDASEDRDHPDL